MNALHEITEITHQLRKLVDTPNLHIESSPKAINIVQTIYGRLCRLLVQLKASLSQTLVDGGTYYLAKLEGVTETLAGILEDLESSTPKYNTKETFEECVEALGPITHWIEENLGGQQMIEKDTFEVEADTEPHKIIEGVDFRKRTPPRIGDTSSHKDDLIKGEKRGMEKQVKKVFIGHGRSPIWRELKDFLQDRLELEWVEFNREPVAGFTAKERLEAMLDEACFAFLIMTAEDEHSDQTKHARENVTHELGLFQGRLGFEKAIILREEGCTEFSNIHGVQDIRFPPGRIMAVSEEVRRVLEREGILSRDELERAQASSRTFRTTVIQRIGFGYFPKESPIRKDWALAEGTLPEFTTADYFGGKALTIQQTGRYALDYDVEPAARFGKSVEFVAKFKSGAAIYAHIDVQSKDHSTSERGWIQFRVGTSQPERHPAGNEWVLYVTPTRFEGDWPVFHIDLVDAVNQTFGNEGKSFEQLIGFRLRGNLELACISVFES